MNNADNKNQLGQDFEGVQANTEAIEKKESPGTMGTLLNLGAHRFVGAALVLGALAGCTAPDQPEPPGKANVTRAQELMTPDELAAALREAELNTDLEWFETGDQLMDAAVIDGRLIIIVQKADGRIEQVPCDVNGAPGCADETSTQPIAGLNLLEGETVGGVALNSSELIYGSDQVNISQTAPVTLVDGRIQLGEASDHPMGREGSTTAWVNQDGLKLFFVEGQTAYTWDPENGQIATVENLFGSQFESGGSMNSITVNTTDGPNTIQIGTIYDQPVHLTAMAERLESITDSRDEIDGLFGVSQLQVVVTPTGVQFIGKDPFDNEVRATFIEFPEDPGPECGDDVCEEGEDHMTCPDDCDEPIEPEPDVGMEDEDVMDEPDADEPDAEPDADEPDADEPDAEDDADEPDVEPDADEPDTTEDEREMDAVDMPDGNDTPDAEEDATEDEMEVTPDVPEPDAESDAPDLPEGCKEIVNKDGTLTITNGQYTLTECPLEGVLEGSRLTIEGNGRVTAEVTLPGFDQPATLTMSREGSNFVINCDFPNYPQDIPENEQVVQCEVATPGTEFNVAKHGHPLNTTYQGVETVAVGSEYTLASNADNEDIFTLQAIDAGDFEHILVNFPGNITFEVPEGQTFVFNVKEVTGENMDDFDFNDPKPTPKPDCACVTPAGNSPKFPWGAALVGMALALFSRVRRRV